METTQTLGFKKFEDIIFVTLTNNTSSMMADIFRSNYKIRFTLCHEFE